MLDKITLIEQKYLKIGAEKALLILFSQNPERNNIINFTELLQKINTNGTYLKRDLLKVPSVFFKFYLDDEEISSALLENIEFIDDTKNNMTWMRYSIPEAVLELISKKNFNLKEIKLEKIKSIYTLRFFEILQSNTLDKIELSKVFLFDFFKLPPSYKNKTNLTKKFLIPLMKELHEAMELKIDFNFFPEKAYEKIIFSIQVPEEGEEELINPMDILLHDMFLKFKEEEQENIISIAKDIYDKDNEERNFDKVKKLYIVKALKK